MVIPGVLENLESAGILLLSSNSSDEEFSVLEKRSGMDGSWHMPSGQDRGLVFSLV